MRKFHLLHRKIFPTNHCFVKKNVQQFWDRQKTFMKELFISIDALFDFIVFFYCRYLQSILLVVIFMNLSMRQPVTGLKIAISLRHFYFHKGKFLVCFHFQGESQTISLCPSVQCFQVQFSLIMLVKLLMEFTDEKVFHQIYQKTNGQNKIIMKLRIKI